jgi:hypothetical protein
MSAAECSALLAYDPGVVDPRASTKRMVELEYRLEKLDPHHRFGAVTLPLLRWWNTLDHTEFPNFFAFLDLIDARIAQEDFRRAEFRAAAGVDVETAEWMVLRWLDIVQAGAGVVYPTLAQRSRYRANVVGGLIHWRGALDEEWPLSTGDAKTAWGNGGYVWIMDRWDRIFTGKSQVGRFHHSTYAMGRAVRGAGEWDVENGRVRRIAPQTGHYRISLYQFYESVRRMRDVLGLNLEYAWVELWERDHRATTRAGWAGHKVERSVTHFLANPDLCSRCVADIDEISKQRDYGVADSDLKQGPLPSFRVRGE